VNRFIQSLLGHAKQLLKLTLIGTTGWIALVSVTSVVGIAALFLQTPGSVSVAEQAAVSTPVDADAWGYEALEVVKNHAQQFSPVALANACGLGASSCFRCHNGKRAALPNMDEAAAPWHAQHAKVNYSCTGCHKGNPRILKQEIAHKNLVVNPLAATSQTCATCHAAGDIAPLSDSWRNIGPHLFENLEKGSN
jgi:nitrate/TMAO reductase-like tetraheme cytochrome c subunit